MSNVFDFNSSVVDEGSSIKDAMKAIDKNLIGIAFIVDAKKSLKGVVTDGDIRRALLQGISINDAVSSIVNKNPLFVRQGNEVFDESIRKSVPVGGSLKIPVVDDEGKILRIVFLYDKSVSFSRDPNKTEHVKQVLVVGGAGYFGAVLARKLLSKGYRVKVLDNVMYGDHGIKDLYGKEGFTFVNGDMRNMTDVVDAIKGVDAVIHLASLVGDPACTVSPRQAIELNYFSTKLLADVCKYFQINRFIFSSTCSNYGASSGDELLAEEAKLNPVSIYAKMKINSEQVLLDMEDGNFAPTIMRMPTLFGVSPRMRFDLVINLLSAKAVVDKKITVFGGEQWRPFLHLEDAADAYIRCLELPIEKIKGGIFNVGSEINNYKIIQIAEIIKKIVPDADIVVNEDKADKRNYRIAFSRFKSVFDMELKHGIEYGVNEVLALDMEVLKDYNNPKYRNIA
ncbi:MAG: NAD-dependent epimerase/dehydratase family protein [Candidatus Micrarchaeota archaeon]